MQIGRSQVKARLRSRLPLENRSDSHSPFATHTICVVKSTPLVSRRVFAACSSIGRFEKPFSATAPLRFFPEQTPASESTAKEQARRGTAISASDPRLQLSRLGLSAALLASPQVDIRFAGRPCPKIRSPQIRRRATHPRARGGASASKKQRKTCQVRAQSQRAASARGSLTWVNFSLPTPRPRPWSADDDHLDAEKKRKLQNRAAQRAFRERKERHVAELEERVKLQEEQLREWVLVIRRCVTLEGDSCFAWFPHEETHDLTPLDQSRRRERSLATRGGPAGHRRAFICPQLRLDHEPRRSVRNLPYRIGSLSCRGETARSRREIQEGGAGSATAHRRGGRGPPAARSASSIVCSSGLLSRTLGSCVASTGSNLARYGSANTARGVYADQFRRSDF